MAFRFKFHVLALMFCIFSVLVSGCTEKEAPAAASGALSTIMATETVTPQASATQPAEQKARLFDFAGKTPESVLQDFNNNSSKYQDFKKPNPGTSADAGFSDRDYLLQSLSAGMGGCWDWLFYHNDKNDTDYEKLSKFAILRYYYFKHLYDMAAEGKISIGQANTEKDCVLEFTNSNTPDVIQQVSDQVDQGVSFTELRQNHPEWFTRAGAVSDKK